MINNGYGKKPKMTFYRGHKKMTVDMITTRRNLLKLFGAGAILATLPKIETPSHLAAAISPGKYVKDGETYHFGPGIVELDNVSFFNSKLVCHDNTTILLKDNTTIVSCEVVFLSGGCIRFQGKDNIILNNVVTNGLFTKKVPIYISKAPLPSYSV